MFAVKITVFLPMSWDCPCHGNAAVFTPDKQTAFKAAVAEVAGVSTEDVALAEIAVHSPAKRRLLTEGIRVEVHVVAASKAAAEEIAQRLTAWKLNRELAKVGLPAASVIEPASVHQVSSTRGPNSSVDAIVGFSIAGLVVFMGMALCVWRHKILFLVKRRQAGSSRVAPLQAADSDSEEVTIAASALTDGERARNRVADESDSNVLLIKIFTR